MILPAAHDGCYFYTDPDLPSIVTPRYGRILLVEMYLNSPFSLCLWLHSNYVLAWCSIIFYPPLSQQNFYASLNFHLTRRKKGKIIYQDSDQEIGFESSAVKVVTYRFPFGRFTLRNVREGHSPWMSKRTTLCTR